MPASKPMTSLFDTEFINFITKIKQVGDCLIFTGRCNNSGYGQFMVRRDKPYCFTAHRLAYFLATGDDPIGYEVMHTCANKICCNPEHLIKGTHAENMRELSQSGRASFPRPNSAGVRNSQANFTEKDIPLIVQAYKELKSTRKVASMFKVARKTVRKLARTEGE